MLKAHCDNCDALIHNANPSCLVSVQPWGFQCVVTVTIKKEAEQVLCGRCLKAAALAFAEGLQVDPS